MKRKHAILLGVLAVQIILAVIVFLPNQVATGSGEPVFADVTADQITKISITDNENNYITVEKVNGAWVLPDAGNYPANETAVTEFLTNLLNVTKGTLVTSTKASHGQLQVAEDDFVRRISVTLSDGTAYILYLGTSPRYTSTYFRVEGDTAAYQTADLSTWQVAATASNWTDTAYVNIDQESLVAMVLENAQGTFNFVKSGEEWLLTDLQADETLSAGNISAIVRNASLVTLQQPLGTEVDPAYGLDAPAAKVTLRDADGVTYELLVGARDPVDSTYVVKSSESDYYVRVAEYLVKPMVENDRESFIAQPTPTPEAEIEP